MDNIPFGPLIFLLVLIIPAIWGRVMKSETVRRRLNLPASQPQPQSEPGQGPRRPRPPRQPAVQRRQRVEQIAEETGRAREEVDWTISRQAPRLPPILPPPRPKPRPSLLTSRSGLRQAILMQEILGPPKALRRDGDSGIEPPRR